MNQLALKKDITSQKKEQCSNFFMPGVTEDIRPIMKIVFFEIFVDSINVQIFFGNGPMVGTIGPKKFGF